MLKAKKAAAAAEPQTPSPIALATSAGITARIAELRQHRQAATDKIIELEKAGTLAASLEGEKHTRRTVALQLLNGDDGPLIEIAGLADVRRKLSLLHRIRGDIDEAVKLAEQRAQALAGKEAADRLAARRKDLDAQSRKIVFAFLSLERERQAYDRLARELRPAHPLPLQGWVLGGRIRDFACEGYRLLAQAAAQQWLTEAEVQKELETARKESDHA